MKISNQLLICLIIVFGIHANAEAKIKRGQKIYKVVRCDCVGEKSGIPTFLSDLKTNVNIRARSKSLKRAQVRADRKCSRKFKKFAKRPGSVMASGCKKKVTIAGTGTWKEI